MGCSRRELLRLWGCVLVLAVPFLFLGLCRAVLRCHQSGLVPGCCFEGLAVGVIGGQPDEPTHHPAIRDLLVREGFNSGKD